MEEEKYSWHILLGPPLSLDRLCALVFRCVHPRRQACSHSCQMNLDWSHEDGGTIKQFSEPPALELHTTCEVT